MILRDVVVMELPPRARRIHTVKGLACFPPGTTSACAENTPLTPAEVAAGGNYLRVRGEYGNSVKKTTVRLELPPRARRILWNHQKPRTCYGTTSACAENTLHNPCGEVAGRNYLRVRGEYTTSSVVCQARSELPPRARRIPVSCNPAAQSSGTTSACAENTMVSFLSF